LEGSSTHQTGPTSVACLLGSSLQILALLDAGAMLTTEASAGERFARAFLAKDWVGRVTGRKRVPVELTRDALDGKHCTEPSSHLFGLHGQGDWEQPFPPAGWPFEAPEQKAAAGPQAQDDLLDIPVSLAVAEVVQSAVVKQEVELAPKSPERGQVVPDPRRRRRRQPWLGDPPYQVPQRRSRHL
jgi:hypothetical protein